MDTTNKNTRKVRVQYSRLSKENRTPKNTLVTVRDGDRLFFGIARCNRKAKDVFHKNIGTYIAYQRALLAMLDYSTHIPSDEIDFKLHKSGLRGYADLADAKEIVNFFYNVDDYCLGLGRKNKGV